MTIEFVEDYIQDKISKNENEIIYTFYELRVKNNLTEEEVRGIIDSNIN